MQFQKTKQFLTLSRRISSVVLVCSRERTSAVRSDVTVRHPSAVTCPTTHLGPPLSTSQIVKVTPSMHTHSHLAPLSDNGSAVGLCV